MNILIVQPWISYRGAETVSVNQCYFLNKLGHNAKIAVVFLDEERLPLHGREITYVLPPRFLSTLCRSYQVFLLLLGPLLLFFLVLKHIRNIDILNPHNLPSVWVAAIVGKLFHKKVIWTCHGVPEKVSWKQKKNIFDYLFWYFGSSWIDYLCVRQIDAILANSEKTVKDIKKRYDRDAELVYLPFEPLPESRQTLPEDVLALRKQSKLLLLQVGNLHSQKRQFITLQALKVVREKVNAGIIFVGDGPDRMLLELQSSTLKLKDSVYFAGYVPQHVLGAYYDLCDSNLLPSVRETFGMSVLEALSYGKPSIVNKETGASGVLSEYVISCESTVKDLAEKILHYFKHKNIYTAKAMAGKAFIRNKFSIQSYCKKFIKLAQDLK